ncbi:alpha/beta hydrolase fold domain-containing protein [Kocuria sp.]|uniref:alpha/beta hydrolase fold domain-containing protein n=1 Tax=Kocuria sp. TaxID=1871328 RepID=UPI0026DD4DBC|nr:alpha/beta hydrolase fold domain-containing protein [Kocuria sp.]MDO4919012.1 alpha/beta hydrolase fold domain-containing protein [Kocuria sp.]
MARHLDTSAHSTSGQGAPDADAARARGAQGPASPARPTGRRRAEPAAPATTEQIRALRKARRAGTATGDPEPSVDVTLVRADPALRVTDQGLRVLPNVWESEATLRASLGRQRPEAAPHRGMHRRVEFERVEVAGRPVVVARPRAPFAREDAPVVVHWHGGAYVHPVSTTHWRWVEALIRRTGATVLVPGYGLAPEHTVDEALALADGVWELARSLGQRVFVSGDSAGGGLAVAQAMGLRDAAASTPGRTAPGVAASREAAPGAAPSTGGALGGLILISPWVDASVSNPEIENYRAADHMLDTEGPRAAARWWAGTREVTDPVVSPAFGDLSGLPRTFVLQGDRDMLCPDTLEFVTDLVRAGVDTTTVVCEGGPHVYALMVWSSRAIQDLDRVVRWMGR